MMNWNTRLILSEFPLVLAENPGDKRGFNSALNDNLIRISKRLKSRCGGFSSFIAYSLFDMYFFVFPRISTAKEGFSKNLLANFISGTSKKWPPKKSFVK